MAASVNPGTEHLELFPAPTTMTRGVGTTATESEKARSSRGNVKGSSNELVRDHEKGGQSGGRHSSVPRDPAGWFKTRYLVALLCFCSFVCNYAIRININIAIVEMVNPNPTSQHLVVVVRGDPAPASSSPPPLPPREEEVGGATPSRDDECGRPPVRAKSNSSAVPLPEYDPNKFNWDEQTQSLILGSVFFGYITTQFAGGRLGELIGAKMVLGLPLFVAALLSLATPLAAKSFGFGAVIIVRILLGMCQGVSYPATHALLAHWSPPLERSKMSSFIYAGAQIGTIGTLAPAGLLMTAWGWESMFYFFGLLTIAWFVAWIIFVSNKPSEHWLIDEEERKYIDASLVDSEQEAGKPALPLPWRDILTSKPFWAMLVAHMGNNFGKWIMLAQLPTYMKNILHFEIQANGFLSALPYVAMFVSAQVYGNFVDSLRSRGILSTTAVRKISNFIAQAGSGLCFIAVAYSGCDKGLSVTFFCLGEFFQGAVFSAYMANHLDLAPNFAGSLMGLTNTAATVTSWAAPIMTGAIINNNQTIRAWRTVFWVAAAILLFDAVEYLIFADGNEQRWNQPPKELAPPSPHFAAVGDVEDPESAPALTSSTRALLEETADARPPLIRRHSYSVETTTTAGAVGCSASSAISRQRSVFV